MKLKQFFILIACVAVLILFITAFRAVWAMFTKFINCAPRDLSASSSLEGATGSLAGRVFITNISGSACYFSAPEFSLALSDSSSTPLNARSVVSLPAKTLLGPGKNVHLSIAWSNWCGAQIAQPVNLIVTLSGFPQEASYPLRAAGGEFITSGPRCDNTQVSSTLTIRSGPAD